MLQAWCLEGLHANNYPPGSTTENPYEVLKLLESQGFASVVAVNSDLGFERYVKPGERLYYTTRLDAVGDEKTTALGTGYFVTLVMSFFAENDGGDEKVGLDAIQLGEIRTGGFFDPNAFDDVKTVKKKAYVHLMPGIPNEAFFVGVIVILLASFTLFERRDARDRGYWKFELTRWPPLARAMKSRWFQPAIQLPVVIAFLAVIVIGLIGSQEPGRNLAPVLTWNIWWIGLIFMVLLFGNLWCHMCPWTAIPDWFMRRGFTPVRKIASLARKYPRFKLWMWPAIVLFAVATWLEIVFDAANRPWLTSVLGIMMIVLSWLLLVVYERKAMCRYVCFVGRVSGQYAMMGMLELRRRDNAVCRACTTSDCPTSPTTSRRSTATHSSVFAYTNESMPDWMRPRPARIVATANAGSSGGW